MHLPINNVHGFLRNNVLLIGKKYIKSTFQNYQYEYQNDWISGEVPWEFIDLDNSLHNKDNHINIQFSSASASASINNDIVNVNSKNEYIIPTKVIPVNVISITEYSDEYTDEYTDKYTDKYTDEYTNIINTDFEKNIIVKAILLGAMKGVYVQIISIDNMITYTQCYTNKVIDMDILLSLFYVILYEKIKLVEKDNIIILKKYNNIQLFEKYIKIRRNSMIVIIIMYILLFRGISNVE
jgi:hypothetical protein